MNIQYIWQEYRRHLKAFLHSKVSNPADVEELLQEILLKTHQNIGSLKAHDKLRPWLFKLAHNAIIDFYRQQGRQQTLSEDELWYGEYSDDIAQKLSECIRPIIKGLPEAVADLIIAVDLEGQSQKALAKEMGISYSALKSRVQRGRVQMRSLFESCCHLELDRQGKVIDYQARSKSCARC